VRSIKLEGGGRAERSTPQVSAEEGGVNSHGARLSQRAIARNRIGKVRSRPRTEQWRVGEGQAARRRARFQPKTVRGTRARRFGAQPSEIAFFGSRGVSLSETSELRVCF